ncbi:PSD1 and planctomycete cytochrome C domain-containing protein [Prosthecobacter sp.]|uniref:PSD1 and planctomycete cytochrome C domain-containing protein n=1 Tax=Prosthecobacter sp. TaxID=1965333 RepID=UPI002AB8B995|nr:PSD1 and planctomycete cytochrome C domain-containing protein [Prosthecobacter sp.]MDZ4401937.1 PSD1 and planctomycete cytochrome C domain-containing protein [Prosthecobacter sp.]
MIRLAFITLLVATAVHAAPTDFAKDVFPVLQRACFECHGSEKQKGDLRLDTASAKHLEIGPDLLRRVALSKEDKEAMPKRGDRLTAAEINHLRDWINSGAQWPDKIETLKHWSYVPPTRPPLPAIQNKSWPKTDLDHFILAKLEANKLAPSPEATPETLIRRLSLDLTGLPPTPQEVADFVAAVAKEKSPQSSVLSPQTPKLSTEHSALSTSTVAPLTAYESLTNRLLNSPQFGPRWARPWLDLARYADSHGFQRDDLREVWAWRDWVVNALNANMPFDQFTLEQIAGDLLPNATPDQIIATGFHRCTPTNVEAGTEPEESRINQVIDRVNTTGAVWLGTTLECAQCHNHKYDPITQRDYYSLLAYYNNTEKEAERANPSTPGSIRFNGTPFKISDPGRETQRQQLAAQLKTLDAQITARQQQFTGSGGQRGNPAASRSGQIDSAKPVQALKPTAFITESDAESELQSDGSVLLTGPVPDKDTYTFEAELKGGELSGLLLEALTHASIAGDGPGRGGANRPNFVLHTFDCALTTPDGKTQPLKFSAAHADYSQNGYAVTTLIDKTGKKAWAIGQRFGEPHWAAFELAKPVSIPTGTKLSIRMEQNFGNGLVMGCLRISSITGDVVACLPAVEEPAPVVTKRGKGKAAATPKSKDPELAKFERQKTALQKQITALDAPTTEIMRELPQPRMSAIFKRGVYTDPADPVTPTVPAIFNSKPQGPSNRITLAKWLTSRDNPLVARVTVNRWWAELFGQGIVATLEDFGIKGAAPSHPELLDWLAVEFIDSGWNMKHVLKKIVMSAAYRQSAGQRAKGEEFQSSPESREASGPMPYALGSQLDPANTLLWHGPRFRLDAETIRDNALAIAGLLNLKQGGVPIRPPQPDGLWKKVGGQDYNYVVSPGAEQYRRGLYVVLKRGSPYPSFMNFDASARMACVVRRSRSNTPLQALTLLNDPVYVEATKAFAKRIVTESPSQDLDSRLQHAFRIALARTPQAKEFGVLKSLWEAQFESAKADAQATKELVTGLELPKNLPAAEFAAWYAVASAILNLDECITKG